MKIKNRIKELRVVPASELLPNPKNWRTHPDAQKNALKGILSEVGMADAVLARELPDGSLMLIDGHLRAETLGKGDVPVLILDVTEAEADKLLATLDPLAAMAESDAAKLDELLRCVDTGSEALQQMLAKSYEDSMQKALKEMAKEGQKDGPISSEVLAESSDYVQFSVPLTTAQEHLVRGVLRAAKSLFGSSTAGDTLSQILADWSQLKGLEDAEEPQ